MTSSVEGEQIIPNELSSHDIINFVIGMKIIKFISVKNAISCQNDL